MITLNCPYDYDDLEFRLEWFEDRLEKVELERDALWVKTQEDEREINDLRDAVKEKKRQRDEAIRIANGLLRLTDHLSSKDNLEGELQRLKLEVS